MRKRNAAWRSILAVLLLTAFALCKAEPDTNRQSQRTATQKDKNTTRAEVNILDRDVVDQDGQPRKFKTDVVGERVVAMNFVFTTCQAVCPAQSLIFKKLQQMLGDDLGKDVAMISVSVDPNTDIPARLKAYAQSRGAKAGWSWITGEKHNIDAILTGVGAYTKDYTNHPAMILVGDPVTGDWTRFNGFPQPELLAKRIKELQAARAAKSSTR